MIRKFKDSYNLLSSKQQRMILHILLHLPHHYEEFKITRKKYNIGKAIEKLRKESDITRKELVYEVRKKHGLKLSIDTYKKMCYRNDQNSSWHSPISEVLNVEIDDLKTEFSKEYKSDLTNILLKPHSLEWLFNTLDRKDKELVLLIIKELQLLDTEEEIDYE